MPQLQFHQGERLLFVHTLRPGRTVIGRADHCDLALPSEEISRVHCYVEQRETGWWLVDRSRHGTRVNGESVDRHLLTDGDRIQLGEYTATLIMVPSGVPASPTATTPVRSAPHEELVAVTESGLATSRARLRVVGGPEEGRIILLTKSRATLGGSGADIVLEGGGPLPAGLNDLIRVIAASHGAEVADTFGKLPPDDLVGGFDCLHPVDSGYAEITEQFIEAFTD